jgi:phosphomethylpyrimidine synthase
VTTQFEAARAGGITPAMRTAASAEQVPAEKVRAEVACGHAVLPANPRHARLSPRVVGRAFRVKINANIGRSTECSSLPEELEKMHAAVDAGADFLMDLSVGPGLSDLRRAMLASCPLPFGTVPIYEALWRAEGSTARLTPEGLLAVIHDHARQGVDFMTLHAGLLQRHVPLALKRLLGIVSRGGAILAEWMTARGVEKPLYTRWDDVLEICREHDVTVSLGDGLRPGCLADASDAAQFAELEVLGELVQRSRRHGVQVMVEGPGHIPFDQIQMNVAREQQVCDGAPFYVLGPVVTDVAPGYDHISSCIGAAAAAFHGAALLCYVTPAEHLGLPTLPEVRAGIAAYRIAAHAADVAKHAAGARDWDDSISRARADFDWERQFQLALDGETARTRYAGARARGEETPDHCTMCGREFCALRISKRLSHGERR